MAHDDINRFGRCLLSQRLDGPKLAEIEPAGGGDGQTAFSPPLKNPNVSQIKAPPPIETESNTNSNWARRY